MTAPRQATTSAAPEPASEPPAPGRAEALSALVEELARAPERELHEAWQRGHHAGERIGRFELLREVGRGGFGVVFEARDLDLGRSVAFKALRAGRTARDAEHEALLRREAEAVAQLSHPNIVTLHDLGRCDSGPYLILELLRGEPLARRLDRGPLSPKDAVRIATGVARALAHAHAHGVLHRDLKPANVFLGDDGAVKVLDFGIAHVLGTGGPAGSGTPGYMAPEQVRGGPEDARTDLFALGVVLHEMLAGATPGAAGGAPLPPSTPRRVRELCARLVDPDPASRPASAAAVLARLEVLLRVLDPPPRRPGRRRRIAAAVVLAATVAAVAGFWAGRGGPRTRIAIADAANPTGNAELDALSGMLAKRLEPSRRIAVVERQRLLDLAARGGARPDRLGPDAARMAARAAHARVVLLPGAERSGDGYDVSVTAVDPEGAALFEAREHAEDRDDAVQAAVARLAAAIRRGLRESEAEVSASRAHVADVLTADLEAYRQYFLGEQCAARPLYGKDCTPYFRRAVARDPGFAAAHYQLAIADAWGGDRAGQRDAIRRAAASAARASERDRLLIRAWAAHLDGDDASAIARYREAAERWPEDAHVRYMIGDLLRHQDRFADAADAFEKAAELDPDLGWAPALLAECLGAAGRTDALRARIRAWEARPDAAALHALSVAYGWAGDAAAAEHAAQRGIALGGGLVAQEDLVTARLFAGAIGDAEKDLHALAGPGSEVPRIGAYGLAAADAYRGRLRAAASALDALAAAQPELARDAVHLALRADLLAGAGDARALRAAIEALREIDPRDAAQHAAVLAWLGDAEGAEELARALPPDSILARTWRGVAAVRRGQVEAGLEELREVSAEAPADVWRVSPLFLYGALAAEHGRHAEAIDALARFERLYLARTMWRGWAVPRARLLRAQALIRLGNAADARVLLDATLPELRSADDLPGLAEARALRTRLGGHAQ